MSLRHAARDPKTGMTLGDLAAFVYEARQIKTPDHTPLDAYVGLKGQIKEIKTRPDRVRPEGEA